MRDMSPLESWEIEVRLSDKNLAHLFRCIIKVGGKISDTHRMHAKLYEGLKDAWREPVQVLVQVPRDSVEEFRTTWGSEMWRHPVVRIPRGSMGNRRREYAWKNQGRPHWSPEILQHDRVDAI